MKKSYSNRVWVTKDKQHIRLCNMQRSHIMNALQWCQRRTGALDWDGTPAKKDGFTYNEWATVFTIQLLVGKNV